MTGSEILPSSRAARLRRIATLVDDQAERSSSPAKARAIACEMRLRASELETGPPAADFDEEDATGAIAAALAAI